MPGNGQQSFHAYDTQPTASRTHARTAPRRGEGMHKHVLPGSAGWWDSFLSGLIHGAEDGQGEQLVQLYDGQRHYQRGRVLGNQKHAGEFRPATFFFFWHYQPTNSSLTHSSPQCHGPIVLCSTYQRSARVRLSGRSQTPPSSAKLGTFFRSCSFHSARVILIQECL